MLLHGSIDVTFGIKVTQISVANKTVIFEPKNIILGSWKACKQENTSM